MGIKCKICKRIFNSKEEFKLHLLKQYTSISTKINEETLNKEHLDFYLQLENKEDFLNEISERS